MKLIVSIVVLLTGFMFIDNASAMNKPELIERITAETGLDVLQKQQPLLQSMSNASKTLHNAAMIDVRKTK